MKFEEIIASIKTKVQSTINADSSKEQIDLVNDICSNIDEVANSHNTTVTELHEIKDAYIKAIRTSGSPEKPTEPTEPDKPKSLEEIVTDLQTQQK